MISIYACVSLLVCDWFNIPCDTGICVYQYPAYVSQWAQSHEDWFIQRFVISSGVRFSKA